MFIYLKNKTIRLLERFGYFYPQRLDYKKISRILYFYDMYKIIENLEGSIVECGVGLGDSLIVIASMAKREGKNRKVYGFDSFEGFPEPSEYDRSSRNPKKGDVWRKATLDRAKINLAKAGVNNVQIIKGFFQDTTKNFSEEIAMLHIDVDLYGSYKSVLENLYPMVVFGGVIMFDEYKSDNWPGATKAIDDFFMNKNCKKFFDKYTNKMYITKLQ